MWFTRQVLIKRNSGICKKFPKVPASSLSMFLVENDGANIRPNPQNPQPMFFEDYQPF